MRREEQRAWYPGLLLSGKNDKTQLGPITPSVSTSTNMPPPSIGKRLWKSAGTYTRVQQNIDKAVKESEQQEKLSSVRVAVLVPNELLEVVCAAAQGFKVKRLCVRCISCLCHVICECSGWNS